MSKRRICEAAQCANKTDSAARTIKSIELTKQSKHNEVLKLLNGTIAESLRFHERQPTCTLYQPAAVIARACGNLSAANCHYGTVPARKPKNPLALYRLTLTTLEQGDPEKAKKLPRNATPAWSKVTTKF